MVYISAAPKGCLRQYSVGSLIIGNAGIPPKDVALKKAFDIRRIG
jgi:hypothetical protein